MTGGTGVPPVSAQNPGMSGAANVAALEHSESVAFVGHVVASLQRGYVSADMAKGCISPLGVAWRNGFPFRAEARALPLLSPRNPMTAKNRKHALIRKLLAGAISVGSLRSLSPVALSLPTMVSANTELTYDSKIEGDVIISRLDAVINWIRTNSMWPMPMGLACCAIELMGVAASRFDIARFGAEVMRFSPRQADCMIVSGTVTYKMAPQVRRIYDQMPAPKWVIAMGACASSGGMYRSYATLQGVDRILPVDVYVSGCPPRPEALLDALIALQAKVRREPAARRLFQA